MNTFGNLFTLTSFGESHGRAIGGVVDGMPAGIPVDMEYIQRELNRRRPGQSSIVTSRKENDRGRIPLRDFRREDNRYAYRFSCV